MNVSHPIEDFCFGCLVFFARIWLTINRYNSVLAIVSFHLETKHTAKNSIRQNIAMLLIFCLIVTDALVLVCCWWCCCFFWSISHTHLNWSALYTLTYTYIECECIWMYCLLRRFVIFFLSWFCCFFSLFDCWCFCLCNCHAAWCSNWYEWIDRGRNREWKN